MAQQNETQTQPQTQDTTTTPPVRKPRGFAAMNPEQRSEISRKGGRVAHQTGRAHQFTPEEARAAGRKGGQATHRRRGTTTPAVPADVPET